jgi:NitT/TauT family transport system ATP-binding protein
MKLECRHVIKFFTNGSRATQVIDDISFRTTEGEFLCILGPSGCGKTTLLKIIAGLIDPSSGDIIYSGNNTDGPNNSMVFQEHGVFPWMNVIDNVAFGLEMRGISRKERYVQSLDFLKRVGLAQYATRNPHELSVGMRQRIAIARAFVNNPAILLMDEPFGSLDAQTRLILQDELLKIWSERKKTVIFVTHDIDEAILLGDRVLVMTRGPGKIREVITVGISRPRNLQMESTQEFVDIRMKIWNSIRSEVEQSMTGDRYETEH